MLDITFIHKRLEDLESEKKVLNFVLNNRLAMETYLKLENRNEDDAYEFINLILELYRKGK